MNKIIDISKTIGSGITPLRSNDKYWKQRKYPWLKTEQLGEFLIDDTTEYISQFAVDNTSIKLWLPNTISVAMYGEGKTRGNVSIINKIMATNQACCNIVVDEKKADYKFVYYWLKNNYLALRNLSSGVRKNLNSDDIKNFDFPDVCLSVQTRISAVLYCIDQKIQNNKKIIGELEDMSKTIYDYWFTQFDFPDENGKPYKSSGGAMVYNEELKREIPLGWNVGNLYDIADYINGLPCQKYRPLENENSLPVVKIKEMHTGITKDTEVVSENIPLKNKIDRGDILFSWSATLEVMLWFGETAALNQHIFKVIPKNNYNSEYVFHQLSEYVVHFVKMAESRKTTMGHITSDHLEQSQIVLPPKNIVDDYQKIISSMQKTILKCEAENQQLTDIRDWLLPMLMNGQAIVKKGKANDKRI